VIDKKTGQQMAHLARLALSESEVEKVTAHLSKILEAFEKLAAVDTTGVEPLVTPIDMEPFWREDAALLEYSAEEMTRNAPARMGHLFKVPPVV
jgi:aspartyl-tRNA(Asn)/glutamyl-tRNA(Gln) amidotransferase subunit C